MHEIYRNQASLNKSIGVLLIAASVAALLVVMHHPIHGGEDFVELSEEIQEHWVFNAIIHIVMVAIVMGFLLGASYIPKTIGHDRLCVRAGAIIYAFGGLGMIFAASISGLSIAIATQSLDSTSEVSLLIAEAGFQTLMTLNETAALGGMVAMSLGVLFWSISMFQQGSRWPVAGFVGIFSGVLGVVGVFGGHLGASVHGMIIFASLQSLWNITVGIHFVRGRA